MTTAASTSRVEEIIRVALPTPGTPLRDPLGRKPGESLDTNRFSTERLAKMKAAIGRRAWASVWQQDPVAEGAGIMSRYWFVGGGTGKSKGHILSLSDFEAATDGLEWCRFWDVAYTAQAYNKPDPDFTVGTLMALRWDGWGNDYDVYVKEQTRFRESWGTVRSRIRDVALLDGPACYVGIEANGPQKAAWDDIRMDPDLATFVVLPLVTLPEPLSWTSIAELGRMHLCAVQEGAPNWHNPFFDEGEAYPNGNHDDTIKSMCGALALCANRRAAKPASPVVERLEITSRWGAS